MHYCRSMCGYHWKQQILPVVIGKAKCPCCFGKMFDPNLLLHYYYNIKAWMTGTVLKIAQGHYNRPLNLHLNGTC